MRSLVLVSSLLLCNLGVACENTLRTCEKQLRQLISYRMQAIEYAFGELEALPDKVDIKFVSQRDEEHARFGGRMVYDREHQRLIVPRRYVSSKMPNPLRSARNYWPFYRGDIYIDEFPVIGAIDNAIWGAYLQEAAHQRGGTWPHEGCLSVDMSKRLPSEMLPEGIAEFLTTTRTPLFNENRLDRIWPDDLNEFERYVDRNDSEYRDVQRYGGILLVRPIIGQFGVPRALAYIAGTPFSVDGNSMRKAALRYQQRAREALSSDTNTAVAVSSVVRDALAPSH